jgi:hypothetical protein
MVASSRKVQDIYAQLDQLNAHHRNVEAKLRALRSATTVRPAALSSPRNPRRTML